VSCFVCDIDASSTHGQEAAPVKITVYADSVINTGYFEVFLVDSLIRNHEVINVISMPQLRDMFASSEFRRVKLLMSNGREGSDDEYAIDPDGSSWEGKTLFRFPKCNRYLFWRNVASSGPSAPESALFSSSVGGRRWSK